MANNDNDCSTFNNYIIFIIFCIIIIILIISLLILVITIINYILFTVYCINDNATDYLTEDLTTIILGSKYKYRLLNYIKNIHNQNNKEGEYVYNIYNKYDYMSSDLYIHTVIEYYNYIVKLLLTIIFVVIIGLLYNMFVIIISWISSCLDSSNCEFILSNIYYENTYVFYIIIIIVLFIGIHSYIYTYVFNKNIYKDLYDIYGNNDSNYKTSDIIIFNIFNDINNTDEIKNITDTTISDYLYNIRAFSDDNIRFGIFLDDKGNLLENANSILRNIRNEGIINNHKFIIPSEIEAEDNTNLLFKDIYKTDINTLLISSKKEYEQELLANKIFLYLIYHYVITYNREDPYILHKINNIFLHTFDNIYNIYIEEEKKKFKGELSEETIIESIEEGTDIIKKKVEKLFIKENFIGSVSGSVTSITPTSAASAPTDLAKLIEKDKATEKDKVTAVKDTEKYVPIDKLVLLEKFNTDIKKMYDEINCSFTIKYLLPMNTKKEDLFKRLHSNADLILKYIYKYKFGDPTGENALKGNDKKVYDEFLNYYINIVKNVKDISEIGEDARIAQVKNLKKKIYNKITAFTDVFSDFTQENKTLGYINTTIYKINFYLAAEMMQVIIFILLVLFILYKSKKYPFLEKYINLSIVYAILIINEVVSAILGII